MKNAEANTQGIDPAPTATDGLDERTPTRDRSSQSKAVPQFTPAERAARGKAARAELPRSAHAA
jgi:hypothetical protein